MNDEFEAMECPVCSEPCVLRTFPDGAKVLVHNTEQDEEWKEAEVIEAHHLCKIQAYAA